MCNYIHIPSGPSSLANINLVERLGDCNAFVVPSSVEVSTFGAQRGAAFGQQQRQKKIAVKYSDVETSDADSVSSKTSQHQICNDDVTQMRMVLRSHSKTMTKAVDHNKDKAFEDGVVCPRTVIPPIRYVVDGVGDINVRVEDSDACSRTVMSPRRHVVDQDGDACSRTVSSPRRYCEDSDTGSRTNLTARKGDEDRVFEDRVNLSMQHKTLMP